MNTTISQPTVKSQSAVRRHEEIAARATRIATALHESNEDTDDVRLAYRLTVAQSNDEDSAHAAAVLDALDWSSARGNCPPFAAPPNDPATLATIEGMVRELVLLAEEGEVGR